MREFKWQLISIIAFGVLITVFMLVLNNIGADRRAEHAAEDNAQQLQQILGSDEPTADLANPATTYQSSAQLASATGLTIAAPAGAANIAYSALTFQNGIPPIAQVDYELNGYACTYRVEHLGAYQNISGVDLAWTTQQTASIGTVSWDVKIADDGRVGIALNLGSDGLMKSLLVQGTDITVNTVTAAVSAMQR